MEEVGIALAMRKTKNVEKDAQFNLCLSTKNNNIFFFLYVAGN